MSQQELRDIEAEIALLSAQAGHFPEGSAEKMAVLAELARLFVRQEDIRKEAEKQNAFEDAYWDAKQEMAAAVSAINIGYRDNVKSLFTQLGREDAEAVIAEREAQIDQMMKDYAAIEENVLSPENIAELQSSELEVFEAENMIVGVLNDAAQEISRINIAERSDSGESSQLDPGQARNDINTLFESVRAERNSIMEARKVTRESIINPLQTSEEVTEVVQTQSEAFRKQAEAFLDKAINNLNQNETLKLLNIEDKLKEQNQQRTSIGNNQNLPINITGGNEIAR